MQRGPGPATVKPGPTGHTVPESGRTCCSCSDRAGSAEPRAERPSLSPAHASFLARQPVAGFRIAVPPRSSPLPPPHRHIQVVSGLLANEGRGRQDDPNGRGRAPRVWETSARDVTRSHVRDVTRARYAPRSKPARSDPDPGPRLRRWGLPCSNSSLHCLSVRRFQAGTRWRQSRIYYQSPGCRQGTILAPVMAWRRLPGSGAPGH